LNILALAENARNGETMKTGVSTAPAIDKKISTKRVVNGYTVNIRYTNGKTLYQCMERVIKNMNDNLQYKIL